LTVHFILGQPGSGKDTRASIVGKVLDVPLLRFGTVFSDYTKRLSFPKDHDDLVELLGQFEDAEGGLVRDKILDRLDKFGLVKDNQSSEQELTNAFLIAYFGWFKTGLIPNEVTNDIFQTEFQNTVSQSNDLLLTSFPYTISQYECLTNCLDETQQRLGYVFLMDELSPTDLLARMTNRLSCEDCGEVIDDKDVPSLCECGGSLSYRRDKEISAKKIEAYNQSTKPLIELLEASDVSIITLRSDYHSPDAGVIKQEIHNKIG